MKPAAPVRTLESIGYHFSLRVQRVATKSQPHVMAELHAARKEITAGDLATASMRLSQVNSYFYAPTTLEHQKIQAALLNAMAR